MSARARFVLPVILLVLLAALAAAWLRFSGAGVDPEAFEKAQRLLEAGKSPEAVPLLERVASARGRSPRREEAGLLLARLYLEQGKSDRAEPLLEELSKSSRAEVEAEARFRLGEAALKRGDVDQAGRIWEEYLSRFPRSPWAGEARLVLAHLRIRKGDPSEAREGFERVVNDFPGTAAAEQAQKILSEINLRDFLSGDREGWIEEYTVASGDSLSAIAERYRTTPDLLQALNRLKNDLIRDGQKLKVPARRFEVLVSKSRNTLTLLYDGAFFKCYPAGTGRDNSTPAGTFTIVTKLVDPPWYTAEGVIPPDDSRNILGSRWMGFNDPWANYGIHGTTEPETVGTHSSQGCIRLVNEDVEELYDFLPYGTQVTIIE